MRVHVAATDRILATSGRQLLRGRDPDSLSRCGGIPRDLATEGVKNTLMTARPWKSLLEGTVGQFPTVNVWSVTEDDLIATLGRYVYRSPDGGRTWRQTLELPPSSGQMGVLPSAVAVADGTVYLGEYPLDSDATPRLLASTDCGATWTTAQRFPDVRHLHSVQVDPYDDGLWLTTGDVDRACRLYRYRPQDGQLRVVGGGSQSWRAVELAITPDAILWGMDCVYSDANRVYRLPRSELGTSSPTPEVVHTLPSSVFYAAVLSVDDAEWVAFSTAIETGGDSTAPDAGGGSTDDEAVVVASSSASNYSEWHELKRYRKRRCLSDSQPLGEFLPNANAYVFLHASPERGFVLNPCNTRRDDGQIVQLPPERFSTVYLN